MPRHRYRRLLKKKAIPPKTGNRVSSMFPENLSRLFCNRTLPCTYAAAKYDNTPQPRQICKAGIYYYSARSIKSYIQNKSSDRHCCIPTDISFICSAECSCSRASFSLLYQKYRYCISVTIFCLRNTVYDNAEENQFFRLL